MRRAWIFLTPFASAAFGLLPLVGGLASSPSVRAQQDPPVVRPVPVEGSEALAGFHQALLDLEAGRRDRVRVLHFGDSNVAANLWTAVTRERLQARFGDAGVGYLVPPPWGTRMSGGVVIRGGEAWLPRRYGPTREYGSPDGQWGLAGVAVEGAGGRATLEVRLPAMPSGGSVELHLLGRRRGGSLRVTLDEGPAEEIATDRPQIGLVRQRIELEAGLHVLRLRVTSARPVRLLGVVVESRSRGLVYESLGVNGHRQSALLTWNRSLLEQQLATLRPDLVVLGYGANEAIDPDLRLDRYRDQLDRALGRVRALTPEASCLVVAPVAMCDVPRNAEITRIQREVAPRHGCGFWNTPEVSGGPGSLCGWIRAGLVSRDRLHLSASGYEILGTSMAEALAP